jgi:hypothetical protein
MRKYSFVALALLVVSFAVGIRDVDAAPSSDIWDTYYDCALNENGWTVLSCNGHRTSSGTLNGAYRLREWYGCYDSSYNSQWYYKSGTSWIAFSGPPGPNC